MFFAAVAVLSLTVGSGAARAGGGPDLELVADRAVLAVGEAVRLTQSVPAGRDVLVTCVWHKAVRVGRVDTTGKVEHLRPELHHAMGFEMERVFVGLPEMFGTYHGLSYEPTGSGRKRVSFRFKVAEAGVYLLWAEWQAPREKRWLTGPPVVLTVLPAR